MHEKPVPLDQAIGAKEELLKQLRHQDNIGLLADRNLPLFASRLAFRIFITLNGNRSLRTIVLPYLAQWSSPLLSKPEGPPAYPALTEPRLRIIEAIQRGENLLLEWLFIDDLPALLPRLKKEVLLCLLVEAEKEFSQDLLKFVTQALSLYSKEYVLTAEERKKFYSELAKFLREYPVEKQSPVLKNQLQRYLEQITKEYEEWGEDPEEDEFETDPMDKRDCMSWSWNLLKWSMLQMREENRFLFTSHDRVLGVKQPLIEMFPELSEEEYDEVMARNVINEGIAFHYPPHSALELLSREWSARLTKFLKVFRLGLSVQGWLGEVRRYFFLSTNSEMPEFTSPYFIRPSALPQVWDKVFPHKVGQWRNWKLCRHEIKQKFHVEQPVDISATYEGEGLIHVAVQSSNWEACVLLDKVRRNRGALEAGRAYEISGLKRLKDLMDGEIKRVTDFSRATFGMLQTSEDLPFFPHPVGPMFNRAKLPVLIFYNYFREAFETDCFYPNDDSESEELEAEAKGSEGGYEELNGEESDDNSSENESEKLQKKKSKISERKLDVGKTQENTLECLQNSLSLKLDPELRKLSVYADGATFEEYCASITGCQALVFARVRGSSFWDYTASQCYLPHIVRQLGKKGKIEQRDNLIWFVFFLKQGESPWTHEGSNPTVFEQLQILSQGDRKAFEPPFWEYYRSILKYSQVSAPNETQWLKTYEDNESLVVQEFYRAYQYLSLLQKDLLKEWDKRLNFLERWFKASTLFNRLREFSGLIQSSHYAFKTMKMVDIIAFARAVKDSSIGNLVSPYKHGRLIGECVAWSAIEEQVRERSALSQAHLLSQVGSWRRVSRKLAIELDAGEKTKQAPAASPNKVG